MDVRGAMVNEFFVHLFVLSPLELSASEREQQKTYKALSGCHGVLVESIQCFHGSYLFRLKEQELQLEWQVLVFIGGSR